MQISGYYNVVTAALPAAQSQPAQSPAKPELTHYDKLDEALALIINDQVKVVSFGAPPKKEYSNLPSPLQAFARQVLPFLQAKGFRALVMADLPASPEAEAEAGQKQFGPVLSNWYSFSHDHCSLKETFAQANSLGIALHGAAASSIQKYTNNLLNSAWPIKARTLKTIDALLGQGKTVITFHDTAANDLTPQPKKADASFGWELNKRLGAGYMEIDLFQPELVPAGKEQELMGVANWRNYIPAKGVNVLRFNNGRQVIILPLFSGVRQEQRAVKQPVCE
jgi:hypothetical protein